MSEILVINFKSPPFPGIGGRRWSKISKALIHKGHCVNLIYAEKSPSVVPLHFYNGLIFPVRWKHPLLIQNKWKGKIIQKLAYVKRRLVNGYTFFDEGSYVIQDLIKGLKFIFESKRIEIVFVSCPPYSWTYEVTVWCKKHYPNVKIWVDLRDPWLQANNWGIPGLTGSQRNLERMRHQFVAENADFISSPAVEILDEFSSNCSAQKIHLKHFFDEDDFQLTSTTGNTSVDKDPFWLYAGQFYVGMEEYMGQWIAAIKSNPDEIWRIFSKDHEKFKQYLGSFQNVIIQDEIGSQIFPWIRAAKGLVVALSAYNQDFFTTKFYDYLPWEKPLVYFGPQGKVHEFLNRQGTHLQWLQKANVFLLNRSDFMADGLSFRVEQILNLCPFLEQSFQ
jgi:glycosyltransferase involved in cell wall biosynthesis